MWGHLHSPTSWVCPMWVTQAASSAIAPDMPEEPPGSSRHVELTAATRVVGCSSPIDAVLQPDAPAGGRRGGDEGQLTELPHMREQAWADRVDDTTHG